MGRYLSGQQGRTVNAMATPSGVRIPPGPISEIKGQKSFYFIWAVGFEQVASEINKIIFKLLTFSLKYDIIIYWHWAKKKAKKKQKEIQNV